MDIIKLYSEGFPLTIDRLQFLQDANAKAFNQLTTAVGVGKIILSGAEITGLNISSGAVSIDGEVMEFRGGVYNNRIAVFEEKTEVPYNVDNDNNGDLDLKAADTVRFAMCHATDGDTPFLYSDLQKVLSIAQLMPKIGDVKLILRPYDPVTDLGWSELDMTNTFIMGAGGTHSQNEGGGANSVPLSVAEMPNHSHTGTTDLKGAHSHNMPLHRDSDDSGTGGAADDLVVSGTNHNVQTGTAPDHAHTLNINSEGNGAAHENRPLFKAFNFLIFTGL